MPATTGTNWILDAALAYAERGWRVVPLHPRDKRPRPRDWPSTASDDPAVIRKWWQQVPTGNVGVALGSGSGLVAIDIDSEEGHQLLAEMAGDSIPVTCEMTTGKGSRLLFAIPDWLEIEPRNGITIPGYDGEEALRFQGKGGQCVMPPSVHPGDPKRGVPPGRLYTWVEERSPSDIPPAPMPGWLIDRMCHLERPAWADPQTHGPADSYAPGADFNRRGSWDEALAAAGAKRVGTTRYWTRPGKEAGVSASLGYYRAKDGTPALYVWSGNWPGLSAGKCYDLFGFIAHTLHGGDFQAAARALAAKGYGTPRHNGRPRSESNGKPADDPIRAQEPEAWDEPVPIETGIKVPPFPIEVFPPALSELIKAVAVSTNSPPDYVGSTALALAAGVLGGSRSVDVKAGYSEISSLYIGVVAPKGSGKTPAAAYLMPPLIAEQSRRKREGNQARAFVENVTTSKLANQLNDSPRGLIMIRDELSALFAGFNEFKAKGQGSDRQFYLSCWSGAPVTKDRIDPDSDDVFVPHPRLSIVGGIQPRVLSRFTVDSDDGLFDRFLWSYPDPRPMSGENGLVVPRELTEEWANCVERIWRIPPVTTPEGGERPFFLKLTSDAWDVWVEWTNWLAGVCGTDDFPEELRGPAAKLRGYAARLALTCHAIHEGYLAEPPSTTLDASHMVRGVELAKYYFGHARRVWMASGRDERVGKAKRILRWARDWGKPIFSRRDLWRGLRKSFTEIEDTVQPLRWLVQLGWLRYVGDLRETSHRGQTTTRYEVNPSLLGDR